MNDSQKNNQVIYDTVAELLRNVIIEEGESKTRKGFMFMASNEEDNGTVMFAAGGSEGALALNLSVVGTNEPVMENVIKAAFTMVLSKKDPMMAFKIADVLTSSLKANDDCPCDVCAKRRAAAAVNVNKNKLDVN